MIYSTGSHTKFYHRFHSVWTTKYRYKVMRGEMRERIREIIIQTCQELGVHIETGVLSTDHVHMFISVPPQIALSKVIMRIKGRSSYKIQREFPELRKRYWGQRFWARGFFSTTSGNAVFVKGVVRRFHAASLISEALISFSGFSQTGPAGCQFRVFPDQRCGFCARAVA
ncbi:putative IS200/IS605 family transposase [Octadecabacter arcticus 238]|uniref:Putative IS200/IS605 family transposase n=1 Tax=Octadecabacter arcticus 238 TaxID=391616 RepID=M9RPS5_9RHOB|nr:putative IS200/IS605 family transposase [Octadecabacter arcticus 238]